MKIHLVGHACIVADCGDTSILMDPWLFGKIFNNSWSLLPEPKFDQAMLEKIDYIWISHEHPDHCHFPTLDSFPAAFKTRVTVLIQDREYAKISPALRKLGYERFQPLPHRHIVPLSDQPDATRVYCYHAGLMDSALAVVSQGQVIFNANDARISTGACKRILNDIGPVDVLLNQFSLAAYAGLEPHEQFLPQRAKRVLDNLSSVHGALRAKATIPFASFIYFSSLDNKYVNNFANSARDAADHLSRHGQRTVVLYPGDTYELGAEHDSSRALARFDQLPGVDQRAYDPIESKTMPEIAAAYDGLAAQMRDRYPMLLLRMLRPVAVRMPDLDKTVVFRLAKGPLAEVGNQTQPDLVMNSQPLWFSFNFSFGMQTLGVTARFRLLRNVKNWKLHRMLFSLNNGGLYLHPRYLLTQGVLRSIRARFGGGFWQSIHYYRTSL
ncbi:MAG TPA: MBL fold metallo-hydrolase [Candidatus Acidoferrales bacterium]|nr:MBL fold metallo-hydrolase [Candidatus Acidoferrales bacterium]